MENWFGRIFPLLLIMFALVGMGLITTLQPDDRCCPEYSITANTAGQVKLLVINCGDGKCSEGENYVNCPLDCYISADGNDTTGLIYFTGTILAESENKSMNITLHNPHPIVTKLCVGFMEPMEGAAVSLSSMNCDIFEGLLSPNEVSYMCLNVNPENIISSNIDDSEIHFRVSRSWIVDHIINISSITLTKIADGERKNLVTKITGSDDLHAYFRAEPEGFSYFAILGKSLSMTTTPAEIPETKLPRPAAPTQYCGDGICSPEAGEGCETCQEDCRCRGPLDICMNNTCLPVSPAVIIMITLIVLIIMVIRTPREKSVINTVRDWLNSSVSE